MLHPSLRLVVIVLVLAISASGCVPAQLPPAGAGTQATVVVQPTSVPPAGAPTAALPAASASTVSPAPTAVRPAGPVTVVPAAVTAVVGPQGPAEGMAELPSTCQRLGLPTLVNRDLSLCFAYPQGFTVGASSQGKVEVRGPAAGAGPEPLFASLTVEQVPYQGVDLAAYVAEYVKSNVPAGFPVQVQRKQISIGGVAAEMLEPVPGRLSSRVVFVDYAPRHYFILTFWPSFADTPADKVQAEGQQAQHDMDTLFQIVAATFAGLPPEGVEIAPDWRVELPESCLAAGHPLYADTNDRYCFAFPPALAVVPQNLTGVALQGPALDTSADPMRAGMGLTVEVAARDATLGKLVDDYVASYKDLASRIKRTDLVVGGAQAVRLDAVPGRPEASEVLLLHEGTLFHFHFTPTPTTGVGVAEANDLIETITSSFGFLPAGTPAGLGGNRQRVEFGGVSFVLPVSIGSGAAGRIVPPSSGDVPAWEVWPEHVEITLDGYPLAETLHRPAIWVVPAAEWAARSPEAKRHIALLQDLLEKRPDDPQQLPLLPVQNAAEQLHFQVRYVPFAGGHGVRYVTQYSQGLVPINSHDLFYTFQGLTADGRNYVSAILPVSHPSLPANAQAVSTAQIETWAAKWQNYIGEVRASLAAEIDYTFAPNLAELDGVVGTIAIMPR